MAEMVIIWIQCIGSTLELCLVASSIHLSKNVHSYLLHKLWFFFLNNVDMCHSHIDQEHRHCCLHMYSKAVSEGACGVLGEDVDEVSIQNVVVDAPLLQEY